MLFRSLFQLLFIYLYLICWPGPAEASGAEGLEPPPLGYPGPWDSSTPGGTRLSIFPERRVPSDEPPVQPGDQELLRVATAAYVYEAPGGPDGIEPLELAFADALRRDPRIDLVDLADRLGQAEPAEVALMQAYRQLEQARRVLFDLRGGGGGGNEGELAAVVRLLRQSIATQEKELARAAEPERAAENLRETWAHLATALFMWRDLPLAQAALQTVYNFGFTGGGLPVPERDLRWVPRLYPETMKAFVAETQKRLSAQRPGRLTVGSVPPGAQLLISGRKGGRSPLTLEQVPPGRLYLSWTRRNRRPLTLSINVPSGASTDVAPELPRLVNDDSLQRLEAAQDQVGAQAMAGLLAEAAGLLRVDLLALLRYRKNGDGSVLLIGSLYDRRTRSLVREAQVASSISGPGPADVPRLVRQLLDGARLDGLVPVAVVPPAPPPPRTRFQRLSQTRWFWPLVGTLAGAAVVGAAVGIAVGTTH